VQTYRIRWWTQDVPGSLFELENCQQGRQGGQHGERSETEVVAKRPARVVEKRQRDEKRDQQRFQPDGHGGGDSFVTSVGLAVGRTVAGWLAVCAARSVGAITFYERRSGNGCQGQITVVTTFALRNERPSVGRCMKKIARIYTRRRIDLLDAYVRGSARARVFVNRRRSRRDLLSVIYLRWRAYRYVMVGEYNRRVSARKTAGCKQQCDIRAGGKAVFSKMDTRVVRAANNNFRRLRR